MITEFLGYKTGDEYKAIGLAWKKQSRFFKSYKI